ncbi:hypothetical protein [Stieleria maiorica]|nr:hypothetical protein [Stieleria maiorica]
MNTDESGCQLVTQKNARGRRIESSLGWRRTLAERLWTLYERQK